jgi:hypothetical protein
VQAVRPGQPVRIEGEAAPAGSAPAEGRPRG